MTIKSTIVAAIVAFAIPGEAPTRADGEQAEQPASKIEKPTGKIEQDAIRALERMGTFLRQQQSFTVDARTETDYVIENGQKIRQSARGQARVRRPDHVRVDVVSDRKERQYFYDGRTFTMLGPRLNLYASAEAPPTIRELADELEQRFGLQLPLVDLFRWGTRKNEFAELTSAVHVGTGTLDGVAVDQYAFRQPGLDWQIWIQRGAQPLPRKLVLTTTDQPARPEHSVELTWKLGTKHDDSVFAFVPPKDSHRIALNEITTMPTQTARRARRGPPPRES